MTQFCIEAVLLDCDGVLVDSHEAAAAAWNEWATRWHPGFDFHRDVEHGRRAEDFVAETVADSDRAAATAELAALERRHALDVAEIPGAGLLTAGLPPGRWAVVTSGLRDIAQARLKSAGVAIPADLITAEDVSRGKPAPEPYLTAAQRLGIAPRHCAVFEDAPAGVVAARAAGVDVVIGVGGTSGALQDTTAWVPDLRGITFDGITLVIP